MGSKLSDSQLEAIFNALLNAKADAVAIDTRQRSPEYASAIRALEITIYQRAFEKAQKAKDRQRMADIMRRDAEAVAALLLPKPRGRPRGGQNHHSALARADRQLLRKVWPSLVGLPRFGAGLADEIIEQFYRQVLNIQLPVGWHKQH